MHKENKLLPLFPLQLVLFPEIPLPLHIFESRYREMIAECIEQEKEFGVVHGSGKQIKRYGCTAKIVRTLKEYEDGRSDILVQGVSRFRILDITEERSFLQSRIEYIDDTDSESDAEATDLAREGIQLLQALDKFDSRQDDLNLLQQLDFKTVSFIIAAVGEFNIEQKQQFLEMTSTRERLKNMVEFLRDTASKVNFEDQLQNLGIPRKSKPGFSRN